MKKMRKTAIVLSFLLTIFCAALLFGCNEEIAIELGDETQMGYREQLSSNTTTVEDEVIYYSDFGAKGDGTTDDFDAIINAHETANERGAIVKADKNATYYIGDSSKTAIVQTSTDWGNAQFIIDDSTVNSNRTTWVFNVCSSKKPKNLIGQVESLSKGQKNIGINLDYPAMIVAIDSNIKEFIRTGWSADSGINKTEIFQIDKNGNVDESTPILKDFGAITSLYAYPIDNETLTLSGGTFTTIANRVPREFPYFTRGIYVSRSNTVFDGIKHYIRGEGDEGAGYNGFIKMERVSGVTVQNCILSGRKAYILASDERSNMGSYDFVANLTLNLKVRNCSQANSINDVTLWGIMASNLSKNISFDNVHWSRFDAHQGVYNATIKNSTLRMLSIIGSGKLHVENTTVTGRHFIYFRDDYGSSWDGEVFIKNCVFAPPKELLNAKYDIYRAMIFYCLNDGQHYYGYETKMPTKITIDGFTVEDDINDDSYEGIELFYDFNPEHTGTEPYPFHTTKELYIRDFVTLSGEPYRITNKYLSENISIQEYNPLDEGESGDDEDDDPSGGNTGDEDDNSEDEGDDPSGGDTGDEDDNSDDEDDDPSGGDTEDEDDDPSGGNTGDEDDNSDDEGDDPLGSDTGDEEDNSEDEGDNPWGGNTGDEGESGNDEEDNPSGGNIPDEAENNGDEGNNSSGDNISDKGKNSGHEGNNPSHSNIVDERKNCGDEGETYRAVISQMKPRTVVMKEITHRAAISQMKPRTVVMKKIIYRAAISKTKRRTVIMKTITHQLIISRTKRTVISLSLLSFAV